MSVTKTVGTIKMPILDMQQNCEIAQEGCAALGGASFAIDALRTSAHPSTLALLIEIATHQSDIP